MDKQGLRNADNTLTSDCALVPHALFLEHDRLGYRGIALLKAFRFS